MYCLGNSQMLAKIANISYQHAFSDPVQEDTMETTELCQDIRCDKTAVNVALYGL